MRITLINKAMYMLVSLSLCCVVELTTTAQAQVSEQLNEQRHENDSVKSHRTRILRTAPGHMQQYGAYFDDDFQSWDEGSSHGKRFVNFTGEGQVGLEVDATSSMTKNIVHFQKPKPSTKLDETHACLLTSMDSMADFNLFLSMKTLQQLRTPSPNQWETAWILWHYTDEQHFYYFTLKTDGWELGKEDPGYPGKQRFLKTGKLPRMHLNQFDGINIQQYGNTINVSVNGEHVVEFIDDEDPYLAGKIGLYTEDAYVHFDHISVTYQKGE